MKKTGVMALVALVAWMTAAADLPADEIARLVKADVSVPVRPGGVDTGTKTAGVSDYALRVGRTESVVTGGGEDDSASGLSLSAGYDFYDAGRH